MIQPIAGSAALAPAGVRVAVQTRERAAVATVALTYGDRKSVV